MAHALEVAHAHQVLHLDIKPDNVLVNHQGQVKVTDFGLATLADASGCGTTGGGTIGYMPLEQMRQESLDARSDEWALASLTYEMLTGENPFLAPTLERAEAAIEDAELVLPSLCWGDMDAEVDDVLFFALDPDPDERYDTVAGFAEAMEPFLGDPKRGHQELAELVGHAEEKAEPAEPPAPHIPLVERVSDRGGAVLARLFCAAGAGLAGTVAAANLPWVSGWDQPASVGAGGAVRSGGGRQAACGRTCSLRAVGRIHGARRRAPAGMRAGGCHRTVVVVRGPRGQCAGRRGAGATLAGSHWVRRVRTPHGGLLSRRAQGRGHGRVLGVRRAAHVGTQP